MKTRVVVAEEGFDGTLRGVVEVHDPVDASDGDLDQKGIQGVEGVVIEKDGVEGVVNVAVKGEEIGVTKTKVQDHQAHLCLLSQ
jgi:L-asparaginase II